MKKKFGQGIKLALRVSIDGDQDQRVQDVLCSVQRLISTRARLASVKGGSSSSITVTLAIPKTEDDIDVASLFESIEGAKEEIGIIEFSLNESTLDDVFVKVVESTDLV